VSGWKLRWYTASAVVSCGELCLRLGELEEALGRVPLPDTRRVTTEAAGSSLARVTILTRARHGGAAAARLGDLLAEASPRGWNWETAVVTAEPKREGILRWPRLAVFPMLGEQVSAEAAKTLADWATLWSDDPAQTVLELLEECGLTLSARKG
jgi:hypothetical protein